MKKSLDWFWFVPFFFLSSFLPFFLPSFLLIEQRLIDAVESGNIEEVEALLRDHPDLDINWSDDDAEWPVLNWASWNGHAQIVKLLLAHPDIEVNLLNGGSTPISLACEVRQVSVVRVLLTDPRVDVTLDDYYGRTPLWFASYFGHIEIIEWLIASGKDLGDLSLKGSMMKRKYTALEIARNQQRDTAALLLEKLLADPAQTRHEVRLRLGVLDELAAEVFALTVFLCDELLQLKPAHATSTPATTSTNATRFFIIAKKLPMELQMVLCHRAVGSGKQNIRHKDSEAAFKSLARILLSSELKQA